MPQGIYRDGCTFPMRPCPLSSTKGASREARWIRRRPAPQARGAAAGSPRRWPREPVGATWCRPASSGWSCSGMGSSAYAGGVAAARMRARGLVASSELASSRLLPDWGAGTLVVATSASGGSVETLDALGRLPARRITVALTNTPGSAITQRCDAVVDLAAEPEVGGVACRSYQHTLALLMALECHLTGADTAALAAAVAAAADRERPPDRHRSRLATRGFRAAPGPGGNPPCGAGAPVLLGAAGRPDAARGAAPARGRMRDRRLEPRRRLPDEDHRLPTARLRRIGSGRRNWPSGRPRAAAPSSASGATCRGRGTTCATPATPTTTFGCSPRCWCPNSSPPGPGRLSGCRPRRRWGTRHRAS